MPIIKWLFPGILNERIVTVLLLLSISMICSNSQAAFRKHQYGYFTVGASGMFGGYDEDKYYEGPNYVNAYKYAIRGIELFRTDVFENDLIITYGLRFFEGRDKEIDEEYHDSWIYKLEGTTIFAQFDWLKFGLALGGYFGELYHEGLNDKKSLMLSLRFGNYHKIHFKIQFNDHVPGSYPRPVAKMGIASFFSNDNYIMIGISSAGYFVHPEIRVYNGFFIVPFIAGFNSDTYQFGIALRYRFRT